MHRFLENFADFTVRRSVYPDAGTGNITEFCYLGLGLASEAGEVADIIKKAVRNGEAAIPEDMKEKLLDELGDVFFYVTRLCVALGHSPNDALWLNVSKLLARTSNGTLKNHGKDSVE